MAHLIDIPTIADDRGTLSVVEKILPFTVKRFYYLYNLKKERGGHRHKKTEQAMICLNGSCKVFVNNSFSQKNYYLDSPNQMLFLEPKDWHTMGDFKGSTILLVLASHEYNKEDYISEPYNN